MTIQDSLGVPLEPNHNPVAQDWQENDLWPDDIVYVTEDGLVEKYDAKKYMDSAFEKMRVREYLESKKIN